MVSELIDRLRAFDPDAEVSRATGSSLKESMKWIVKLFFGNHSAKHASVLISHDWLPRLRYRGSIVRASTVISWRISLLRPNASSALRQF